ncbi:hypothetical protein KAU32_02085 [bacterium]|nr:hypothetical protein [bacterium]
MKKTITVVDYLFISLFSIILIFSLLTLFQNLDHLKNSEVIKAVKNLSLGRFKIMLLSLILMLFTNKFLEEARIILITASIFYLLILIKILFLYLIGDTTNFLLLFNITINMLTTSGIIIFYSLKNVRKEFHLRKLKYKKTINLENAVIFAIVSLLTIIILLIISDIFNVIVFEKHFFMLKHHLFPYWIIYLFIFPFLIKFKNWSNWVLNGLVIISIYSQIFDIIFNKNHILIFTVLIGIVLLIFLNLKPVRVLFEKSEVVRQEQNG